MYVNITGSCRWTAFSELLGYAANVSAQVPGCRWTAFSELLGSSHRP